MGFWVHVLGIEKREEPRNPFFLIPKTIILSPLFFHLLSYFVFKKKRENKMRQKVRKKGGKEKTPRKDCLLKKRVGEKARDNIFWGSSMVPVFHLDDPLLFSLANLFPPY